MIIKILIVVAAIALFTITFLINKKIKGPSYSETEDEMCKHCDNMLCGRRKKDKIECEEKQNEE